MRLKILGCSGGVGGPLRSTCLQLDHDIIIDSGTGVGDLTLEEMAALRHIFLTHTHMDHISFLPLLIDSIFDRIKEPIIIHALPESIEALRKHIFNWIIWPDFSKLPSTDHPVIKFEPMRPGEKITLDGRTIEMIPVNHVVPGVGYRVEGPQGVFAFSGDTTSNDCFWQGLNARDRLDLLIVECAFTDDDLELSKKAYHYCPSLLTDDIAKLKHRPDVYITHAKPGQECVICEQVKTALQKLSIHVPVQCLTGGEIFTL
ncbi:MAG: 3',5'-cyclic-nucleotide phosphodiesterase [Gammaproteobacteria bacterium RBG_16_57_12]|nr:MAG: 3',5'-cyclic-nucleotide phosphodiesterase [Gammaproteobacteria bacterium RBG_16_57_12]